MTEREQALIRELERRAADVIVECDNTRGWIVESNKATDWVCVFELLADRIAELESALIDLDVERVRHG